MKQHPLEGRWCTESAFWPCDPVSGAEILQLTGHVAIATSIYCEDPPCSPANRIAIVRSPWCDAHVPGELWVSDIEAGRCMLVDTEVTWVGACLQAYGDLFHYFKRDAEGVAVFRLRFSTLEKQTVYRFAPDAPVFAQLGSTCPDGRYLVSGLPPVDGRYNVVVLDLEAGTLTTLVGGEDYFNPHPRFDRAAGDWVLVQHNRGQRLTAGQIHEVKDPIGGVTLVLARRDGSEVRTLPVARPAIPQGVSGHESWLRGEEAFIYSLAPMDPPYDDGERVGNLVLYRVGAERPRVVAHAPDLYFGHVSTSACGRYWCCDAWNWPHDGRDCCTVAPRIFVGSMRTGRFEFVCDVGGVWPRYENGHAHPYLSADNRYVIFTSTRAGLPQVFRATLPSGLLERID